MTDMEADLILALAEIKRLKEENERLKRIIDAMTGKKCSPEGDLNG